MIILGQTSSNLDSPLYLSTKRTGTTVIRKTQISDDPDFCTCIQQCIPDLIVFTDGIGTDSLKNDWTSFFIPSINTLLSTGASIEAKIIDVDTGIETVLSDPTYGEQKTGNNYYWFKLDWYLVWGNLGFGRYRVVITETANVSGETINSLESPVYNLYPYSAKDANKTVRIYSQQKGKLHHGNDYSNLTVAGNSTPQPFEQQTRLPGRFYSVDSEIDNHHLALNGENRPSYQVKDQLRPKFKLELHLLGSKQINKVVFDELFGSEILITDYNVYNHPTDPRDYYADQYVDIPVKRATNSMPNASATAKLRTYIIDLDYDFDNVFKTNN